MGKRLLEKRIKGKALGAPMKANRLKLSPNLDCLYTCHFNLCDSELYNSQRSCIKQVYNTHVYYNTLVLLF